MRLVVLKYSYGSRSRERGESGGHALRSASTIRVASGAIASGEKAAKDCELGVGASV